MSINRVLQDGKQLVQVIAQQKNRARIETFQNKYTHPKIRQHSSNAGQSAGTNNTSKE
jgi:hypothetical protein